MFAFRTLSLLCLIPLFAAAQPGRDHRIPLAGLKDKIAGGWAGQMIGVSYGAPTEFRTRAAINEGELTMTLLSEKTGTSSNCTTRLPPGMLRE